MYKSYFFKILSNSYLEPALGFYINLILKRYGFNNCRVLYCQKRHLQKVSLQYQICRTADMGDMGDLIFFENKKINKKLLKRSKNCSRKE